MQQSFDRDTAHILGVCGEELVADWLADRGYVIEYRNYRCRHGEIDVVARKDEVIAFVEVKARVGCPFNLSEVITPAKRRKLVRAAKSFMQIMGNGEYAYRFDVALVYQQGGEPKIEYIEQAFTAGEYD